MMAGPVVTWMPLPMVSTFAFLASPLSARTRPARGHGAAAAGGRVIGVILGGERAPAEQGER